MQGSGREGQGERWACERWAGERGRVERGAGFDEAEQGEGERATSGGVVSRNASR